MAEIIGATASVITLAGLFKVCIEAFEFIHCAKNQENELRRLFLKLNIEKCRLLVWGQSLRLDQEVERASLDESPFRAVIRETLGEILELLTDSQSLGLKYGCKQLEFDSADGRLLEWKAETSSTKLNAAFDKLKIGLTTGHSASRLKSMAKWVVCDRKKFGSLVREAKELIDGLQDLTKSLVGEREQNRLMTSHIITIHDQETLSMISEVCESEHPAISDAASCQTQAISMAPSREREVQEWIPDTQAANYSNQLIEEMEGWTLAEFRQNFLDLWKKSGEEWTSPSTLFPCDYCGIDLPTQNDLLRHLNQAETHCSLCHETFECVSLRRQHGCFSRKRPQERTDRSTGGQLETVQIVEISPASAPIDNGPFQHRPETIDPDDMPPYLRYVNQALRAALQSGTTEALLSRSGASHRSDRERHAMKTTMALQGLNSFYEAQDVGGMGNNLAHYGTTEVSGREESGTNNKFLEEDARRFFDAYHEELASNWRRRGKPEEARIVARQLFISEEYTLDVLKEEFGDLLLDVGGLQVENSRDKAKLQELGGHISEDDNEDAEIEPKDAQPPRPPTESLLDDQRPIRDETISTTTLDRTRRFSTASSSGAAMFQCLDCNKMFSNDRDWSWHISRDRRRCAACDRLFECYEKFLEHVPNCNTPGMTVGTPVY